MSLDCFVPRNDGKRGYDYAEDPADDLDEEELQTVNSQLQIEKLFYAAMNKNNARQ